jgi:putative tricarboxylic transport membrane protein
MQDLERWDGYLDARQALFVLDACLSGLAGYQTKAPLNARLEQLSLRARHLITAGTKDEIVISGDKWGGSLFTDSFILGAKGEARSSSGIVSLPLLLDFIQERVLKERQAVNWSKTLTPQLQSLQHGEGFFFFTPPPIAALTSNAARTGPPVERKGDIALPTTDRQLELSDAERAWSSVKDTKSVPVLESFIARYKDTLYANLARERIEELKKQPIAGTAWEPARPVEFIIPAGTGGGADHMARTIEGIVTKHKLMKQPMTVINKSGGAGGEGFLDVKASRGNPHKILITLSNLFTTPLATGIPFSWKDMTPVAMLALDEFILWVNADTPYKSVKDYIDAVKKQPGKFKMGGTGSKQEDQIITVAIEKATGTQFSYVPFRGGGEVAVQLAENHVDSTVNNPIETVAQWRAGKVRPLCVFDGKKLDYHDSIVGDLSWGSIPTCKSQGLDMEYLMLRGIFMAPGATKDQVDYYIGLFQKVRETSEWKNLMQIGAFNQSFLTGSEYSNWVAKEEKRHEALMKTAGFLAK